MDDDQAVGLGGGITRGYAQVARFGRWTLESVGPQLYLLRADVQHCVPAWLALSHLRVWIHRGALVWEWDTDDMSVVDAQFEAVVGQPRLGPAPR